jgi:glutamine synthetase
LSAGLDGIENERDPGKRLDNNMYVAGQTVEGVRGLPLNLLDATRAFEASAVLEEMLGCEFVTAYSRQKQAEWRAFNRHLTEWERRTTLDC